MSKDVCEICKKVYSSTSNQGIVRVMFEEVLEVIDAHKGEQKFSDLLYNELKTHSKKMCLCQECYNKL